MTRARGHCPKGQVTGATSDLQARAAADIFWARSVFDAASGKRASILPKGKVVFVVDDDPSTLKGMRRLLREHGFDCVLFQSAEALQKCDNFDQAFSIVLDINLNDESGIELRHRLIAAGISLPVVYITANNNHATRMAAMESGCIAYLTKPFSAKSLIEPIERISTGLA
jgi:FixJ family two-component response regulator